MANKADLDAKRKVSTEVIQEYAERHDLIFLGECSALANTLIKEHVEALITQVHQVQQKEQAIKLENSAKMNLKYIKQDDSFGGWVPSPNCG